MSTMFVLFQVCRFILSTVFCQVLNIIQPHDYYSKVQYFSCVCPSENNEPMWSVPSAASKITSAIWGPLDEVLVTGHENGDLCQWDVKVIKSKYLCLQ